MLLACCLVLTPQEERGAQEKDELAALAAVAAVRDKVLPAGGCGWAGAVLHTHSSIHPVERSNILSCKHCFLQIAGHFMPAGSPAPGQAVPTPPAVAGVFGAQQAQQQTVDGFSAVLRMCWGVLQVRACGLFH